MPEFVYRAAAQKLQVRVDGLVNQVCVVGKVGFLANYARRS